MKRWIMILALTSLLLPGLTADEPKAPEAEPEVAIVLGPARGNAIPSREASGQTGGGNILVAQSSPDMLSATLTGAVAAKAHPCKVSTASLSCDLCQEFEIVFRKSTVKSARLIIWGRTAGLLRSPCGCSTKDARVEASVSGDASVTCGPAEVMRVDMPARLAARGQSLSILDREGPVWMPVTAGKYSLHQAFSITAAHGKGFFCSKPVSADFAPGEALPSNWLGKRDPFHGAAKDEFGFQVILKVIPSE